MVSANEKAISLQGFYRDRKISTDDDQIAICLKFDFTSSKTKKKAYIRNRDLRLFNGLHTAKSYTTQFLNCGVRIEFRVKKRTVIAFTAYLYIRRLCVLSHRVFFS